MNRLLAALVVAVAIAVTGLTSHSLAQTPATRAPATDTIGKLKATKQIRVAVSAILSQCRLSGQSDPVGYSIDLCKRVIAQLGRAAGVPDLKTTWVAGTVPSGSQWSRPARPISTAPTPRPRFRG
jgi:ABC-type amino acid transport substrate-binding protein